MNQFFLHRAHVFLQAGALVSLALLPRAGFAQAGRVAEDFRLTKITRNLSETPEYNYSGARGHEVDRDARWLEVEAEFAAEPEFTDELTFRYFVLVNGRLLTGEVTHVNIPAGRTNRSVMYVPPRTLLRYAANRAVLENSIQNIAVQIVQGGAVRSELSLNRTPIGWFAKVPQISGALLNKNDTPFAPLYWERYEQIKPVTR